MKPVVFATLFLLITLAGAAHAGDGMSLQGFRNHALPVLVHVDASGKVTQVQPSMQLSPRTDRLLRANLEEMIDKPATQKGKAVSSIFIIQLALDAEKRPDGTYLARFQYVSSMPVPAGSWYWIHINGHRLALAEDNGHGRHRYLGADRSWPRDFDTLPQPLNTTVPASMPSMPVDRGTLSLPSTRAVRRPPGR
jgi:hypothetical protein